MPGSHRNTEWPSNLRWMVFLLPFSTPNLRLLSALSATCRTLRWMATTCSAPWNRHWKPKAWTTMLSILWVVWSTTVFAPLFPCLCSTKPKKSNISISLSMFQKIMSFFRNYWFRRNAAMPSLSQRSCMTRCWPSGKRPKSPIRAAYSSKAWCKNG